MLAAQSIQGTFANVQLPSSNWSWSMEAAGVYITKGSVPVEPVTWGRLKALYR